jgi:hypothetical protein
MKSKLLTLGIALLAVFQSFAQISSVAIIGSATENGWGTETPMERVSDNEWTIDITLMDGEAKFRADNDWAINWGASDFPRGTGVQDGPNIPIPAGVYTVTFNSETGEYFFDVESEISIIGSATPGGWSEDTKMYPDPNNPDFFAIEVDLVVGDAKFRTTGDWATNWGASDFPSGVGVQDGPNIPIPIEGKFYITFDRSTGEYNFEEIIEFNNISIIGDATPGGWAEDTPLVRDANNPDTWRAVVTLTDGELKFRADGDWAVNWGGEDFPFGDAIFNGPNIQATAGEYLVVFNTVNLAYAFFAVGDYNSIGLIGSATPGGWDDETPMVQDPDDKSVWRLQVTLVDGEAKFRADNDWAVNWGSDEFPAGVGFQDGPNIPVTEGEYVVTFNSTTGEYYFELIEAYSFIGLIGRATPNDSWDMDYPMVRDAEDLNVWTIESLELVDKAPLPGDQGVKFRAEQAWTVNWGGENWPIGAGRQDGPNIPIVAGTYKVVFNSFTGTYEFSEPNSTFSIIKSNALRIFPNPATTHINIEVKASELFGESRVDIINMNGEIVKSERITLSDMNRVTTAGLKPGKYLIQISNGKFFTGTKLVIAE